MEGKKNGDFLLKNEKVFSLFRQEKKCLKPMANKRAINNFTFFMIGGPLKNAH